MRIYNDNVSTNEVDAWAIVVVKGWYPTRIGWIYEVHTARDLAEQRLDQLNKLNADERPLELRKTKAYVTA
jgi:hypothetical protein